MARICFKHAGTARAAFGATTVSGKMPRRDVIPIAANEDRAASVTVGSLARGIVNVAGIDALAARSSLAAIGTTSRRGIFLLTGVATNVGRAATVFLNQMPAAGVLAASR